VIAVSGALGKDYHEVYAAGIDAVFSIVPGPVTLSRAMEMGHQFLYEKSLNLARLLAAMGVK
jgi:glycerate kinase